MSNVFKRMKQQKQIREAGKPVKLFRSGSLTEKLSFLLIERGIDGYITDDQIRKEICGDLMAIPNKYERQIKVSIRIRSLVRDVRMRFGIWFGKVWSPKEETFVWKIISSREEFNQLIEKLKKRIMDLETVKIDMIDSRDSAIYQAKVRKFFEETF